MQRLQNTIAQDSHLSTHFHNIDTLKSDIRDYSDDVLPISEFEACQYHNQRLIIARKKHEAIREMEKGWLCNNYAPAPHLCYL